MATRPRLLHEDAGVAVAQVARCAPRRAGS
jgi:hypothetical protein